jgi:hypothetical protein
MNQLLSKSQRIRDMVAANKSLKPSEIQKLLEAKWSHENWKNTATLMAQFKRAKAKKKAKKAAAKATAAPEKAADPNKSAVIREYKATHTTASPKMIAEALSKQGVDVTAQFVSTVLSNAKKKGGVIGKRGPKGKRGKNGIPAVTASLVIDPNVVLAIANDPARWLGELGNVTDVTTLQFFCLNLMGIRLNELKQLQERISTLENPPVNTEAVESAS